MLRALAELTARGWIFLHIGIVAAVAAIVIGHTDTLRVGILLAALPIISLVVVKSRDAKLHVSSAVTPPRIAVGEVATVTLTVSNHPMPRNRWGMAVVLRQLARIMAKKHASDPRLDADSTPPPYPNKLLVVRDAVPDGLEAERTSAAVDGTASYTVTAHARGRYTLGPLSLQATDPFGLIARKHSVDAGGTLLVTPRVHSLPAIAALNGFGQSAFGHRPLTYSDDNDMAIRPWRDGDDRRRVHWRATAHHGELMVRLVERPQRRDVAVLLDTRFDAHSEPEPHGPREESSSFEWAVSATASICSHLEKRGYSVQLVTTSNAHTSPDYLPELATVHPQSGAGASWTNALAAVAGVDVVIAIVGRSPEDPPGHLAALLSRNAHTALIIDVDTDSWSRRSDHRDDDFATPPLYLTATARRGDHIADVWQRLTGPVRSP